MDFPGYVKEHPVISALVFFAVFGTLAYTAANFAQGTFVGNQGCKWDPVENPETNESFSSVSELEDYAEEHGESIPENLQLQVRDGVLHQKMTCVNSGGGSL
jgi:hypothetical protein